MGRKSEKRSIKLLSLREEGLMPRDAVDFPTYREIVYWEKKGIKCIAFNFYNGAVSTERHERLLEVVRYPKRRPTPWMTYARKYSQPLICYKAQNSGLTRFPRR